MRLTKSTLYGIACLWLLLSACTDTKPEAETTTAPAPAAAPATGYNPRLAAELGADDYGMKPYVMAFLLKGPNRDQDSATAAQLQVAHMENIKRMAKQGKLVLAGPFMQEGEMQGIYLFNVPTVEEARALTETDPAVQAGRLIMDLRPWYGSAALMQVNDIHSTLAKESI